MDGVHRQLVVGIGELLWDCLPAGRRPGGAPANVAFHAAQLGHRAAVCTRVGDDALGAELRAYLVDCGLDTRYVQVDPKRPTGTVTVDTRDPGHPSFVIHEGVAWDGLVFEDSWAALMAEAAAVCFGTLAQRCAVSRATIHRALAAAPHALRVYDVNLRQVWYARAWIETSLGFAEIVKLNTDEVGVLAELLEIGRTEPVEFAAALRARYDVDTVCITRAERGCLLCTVGETVDVPGPRVRVVDAVGAGDAFTAALISALLRKWPPRTAATFANHVGGLVASRAGAMPQLGEEFAALVAEKEREACN